MKKDLMKGMLIGTCLTLFLSFAAPVMAQVINTGINLFRIKSPRGTIIEWGENYLLEDGRLVPSSIMYDNTIYIPLPLFNSQIKPGIFLFNGDSNTVTYANLQQPDNEFLYVREEPDSLGIIWQYIMITTPEGYFYLFVWDPNRQFGRVYQLASKQSIEFFDNYVLFVATNIEEFELRKLFYANNPDNQDGETIYTAGCAPGNYVILDKDVLYYVARTSWGPSGPIYSVDAESGEVLKTLYIRPATSNSGFFELSRIEGDYLYFCDIVSGMGKYTISTEYKIKVDGSEAAMLLDRND